MRTMQLAVCCWRSTHPCTCTHISVLLCSRRLDMPVHALRRIISRLPTPHAPTQAPAHQLGSLQAPNPHNWDGTSAPAVHQPHMQLPRPPPPFSSCPAVHATVRQPHPLQAPSRTAGMACAPCATWTCKATCRCAATCPICRRRRTCSSRAPACRWRARCPRGACRRLASP